MLKNVTDKEDFNDLTKAESKTFRILLENIEKELGDDTFKSWFSEVHYHGNGGGVGENDFLLYDQ